MRIHLATLRKSVRKFWFCKLASTWSGLWAFMNQWCHIPAIVWSDIICRYLFKFIAVENKNSALGVLLVQSDQKEGFMVANAHSKCEPQYLAFELCLFSKYLTNSLDRRMSKYKRLSVFLLLKLSKQLEVVLQFAHSNCYHGRRNGSSLGLFGEQFNWLAPKPCYLKLQNQREAWYM